MLKPIKGLTSYETHILKVTNPNLVSAGVLLKSKLIKNSNHVFIDGGSGLEP